MKKNIPQKQLKVLWCKSGNRCSICRKMLVEESENQIFPIGENAHIQGENPASARYNPSMTDEERNIYDNLILVCPTCHTLIDNDVKKYTVEYLKQEKAGHEKWVEDSLQSDMLEISFAEIDVIIKYMISAPIEVQQNFTIVPPAEKIRKNSLSSDVEKLITMGMIQVKQVGDYLRKNPDPEFAERLRASFVERYISIKNKNITGDELFYELFSFACHESIDFKTQAAGLSVLVYFFEICEVFEK
jgi:ferredoxin